MKLRLKECRTAAKKTQFEIAQLIGITRAAYSNIEAGRREPDFKTVNTLADYFGVSTDYLLGREDAKEKLAINADDELTKEFSRLMSQLSPEEKRIVISQIKGILSNR